MRREMGLWKINKAENFKLTANMERLLKFELGQGQSKTLAIRGSHIIHNYKDRLYNVAHVVNAEDVERHRKHAKVHRGAIFTLGPNHAWSMDKYCKLEAFSIQIYAAIDVYSRYPVWIYIGITGRTAVSVLAQYIATLAIATSYHGGFLSIEVQRPLLQPMPTSF
ncbi:hypothetical protein LTR95_012413 [Oleoguttula sp. CCFEE 5521]